MRRIVVSAFVFVLAGCPSSPSVCTPGASVACTGPGGCSGGQACNAAGTGYETCQCGGADAGTTTDANVGSDTGGTVDAGTDAASTTDAWVMPTMGAIRVHWTLMRGPTTLTCAQVTGLDHISVIASSASGSHEDSFPCAEGVGTTAELPFTTYMLDVAAVDGAGASLGSSTQVPVTLAASPCDLQIGTTCVRDANVTIQVF